MEQKILVAKQRMLLDLRAKELAHELKLRHWLLRVRHISEVMKLTFEVPAALLALALIATIGSFVWLAAHDGSFVFEAFAVPQFLRPLKGKASPGTYCGSLPAR